MKKIFTILFSFSVIFTFAQISYTPAKSVILSGTIQDFTDYEPQIDMNDPANLQAQMTWEVIEVSYPSQWDQLAICNPVTCPIATVGAAGSFAFNNGNAYYKATFIHNNVPGYGYVKLKVGYNGNTDTLTLGVNLTSTGISNIPQAEYAVFPNPTTNSVHINFAEMNNAAAMQLTDMTGRSCHTAAIENSNAVYSLPTLQKGSYILNIINNNHQIIGRNIIVIAE